MGPQIGSLLKDRILQSPPFCAFAMLFFFFGGGAGGVVRFIQPFWVKLKHNHLALRVDDEETEDDRLYKEREGANFPPCFMWRTVDSGEVFFFLGGVHL